MRAFYLAYPHLEQRLSPETLSLEIFQTLSGKFPLQGSRPRLEDAVTPEEELKDPFVLEFLDLKDEYSENDLEEAFIRHIESFLLELGGDFTFVGHQHRLRIGEQ